MPEMNYSKLKGRIKEYGYTSFSFAEAIGLSGGHFCEKLKGLYPFTQKDIEKMCTVLEIEPTAIGTYFFTKKVEEITTNEI